LPKRKRERGQGSIGNVEGSEFLYIWYYDRAGKQHHESTKSTLKSVAQEQLNRRLAAMGRGERSPQELKAIRYEDMRQILLNEYLAKGIAADKLIVENGKPTGLKHTGLVFLDEYFKGMALPRIDSDVLDKYREHRTKVKEGEKPIDDTTVNRDFALLRRVMNLTVRKKKLQFTVPYFSMTNEAGNTRTGFLEPAKFAELLAALPEILRPYLLLYYETGCRPKATRQIVWDWVNLNESMIYIPDNTTKNGEFLPVPMSQQLCGMLKKLFRTDAPVFDTTNFRKAFREAADAVGLKQLIAYDLRRGGMRNLKRAGVDDSVAMKISGHKTASVFRRCNITSAADVKGAMRKVKRRNARLMKIERSNASSMQVAKKWQLQKCS
jgi:integrase